ncbi:TonB-dependent receptor, partial [hydrothermal vent metagenome]
MKRIFTFLLLLLFIFSTEINYASTRGKIKGIITDASTGDPLIGANVIVMGTTLGAATGVDGEYIILGINAGQYKVKASMIGYETVIQTQVQVEADRTTIINFNMKPTEVRSAEVVVTAKRDE